MNKKRKWVIKYLAGESENDAAFRELLKSDPELKKEYDDVTGKLSSLDTSKGIEINEQYFSTILPGVKNKVEKKSGVGIFRRSIFAISSAIVSIILFFIFSPVSSSNQQSVNLFDELLTDYNQDDIIMEIENNLSITDYSMSIDGYSGYEQALMDFNLENTVIYEQPGLTTLYSNEYIENISNSDLERILAELENKKYF